MTDPFRFQIGHLKIIDHLLLGVAGHFFAADKSLTNQFELKPVPCRSWEEICDHMAGSRLDGAFLTIPSALTLFAKGLDIRLLMLTHRGGGVIIKKNNLQINTIADFTGKSILIPSRFCVQHMLLHRMITSTGSRLDTLPSATPKVTAETVAPFLMPEIFDGDKEGDIAGMITPEPFGTQVIIDGGGTRLCRTGDLWKNHPCSAFILHNKVIESHPESVSALIRLFFKSAHAIESRPLQWLYPIAREFLDLSGTNLEAVFSGSDICYSPDLLVPDPQLVDTIQIYMSDQMKVLEKKINANRFVDARFITIEEMDNSA